MFLSSCSASHFYSEETKRRVDKRDDFSCLELSDLVTKRPILENSETHDIVTFVILDIDKPLGPDKLTSGLVG